MGCVRERGPFDSRVGDPGLGEAPKPGVCVRVRMRVSVSESVRVRVHVRGAVGVCFSVSLGGHTVGLMLVSFVIPAHNEEKNLGRTLKSIKEAAVRLALEHDIIVADDASDDATPRIAKERGAMVVRHERRQIAATRNLGARHAKGQVLFFIDADTQVNAANIQQGLEKIKGGAVGGGGQVRFDGPIPLTAKLALFIFNTAFRWMKLTGGCFFFCTREAFDKAGGWDETVYASEEIELAKALKVHGRFEIIREPVLTSGRKLRTYGFMEIYPLFIRGVFARRKLVETKEGLGLWYDPRREDPWEKQRPS